MLKYALSIASALALIVFAFNFIPPSNNVEKLTTGVVFNLSSLSHDRLGHAESAHRIQNIKKFLDEKKVLTQTRVLTERSAEQEELLLAHDLNYVLSILKPYKNNKDFFTSDKWSPYVTPYAYQTAATAVGSLIDLSESVARGELANGFAIIRPPGHHATQNQAMGYCIFNNIAIATENLIKKKLAQKILIVDTDAHFGNGIADHFWENKNVYYISHNQEFVFPYSKGRSNSNIKDIKIRFLHPEDIYLKTFQASVDEALENFKPDFIFVSAGYDAHWRDPMSNLSLSLMAYANMSKYLVEKSQQYTSGKIVFSLEGGYDLDVLKYGAYNTIQALIGKNNFIDPIGPLLNK